MSGPLLHAVAMADWQSFISIHNAWDVVVWITTERHAHRERQHHGDESPKRSG